MCSKIWLSKPHFEDKDASFLKATMKSNWITTTGPNIANFEKLIQQVYNNNLKAVALNSGTSAMHIALKLLNISYGDEVICQTFTFCATVNPILYCGATPIFVDSEKETWNMSPVFLEQAIKDRLRKNKKPKAVIVVDSYGMPAKWDEILQVTHAYDIPIIEDSAEALGSAYKGRPCGTFGKYSILSFNGNKIITTSSGGALLCKDEKDKERAIYLSSHSKNGDFTYGELGFNYRMSNVLASLGIEQLKVLQKRIEQRRSNHATYESMLGNIQGIELQKEKNKDFYSNFWLNCVLVDAGLGFKTKLLHNFSKDHIDVRTLWSPLHLQRHFRKALYFGDHYSKILFDSGLCLPSSSNLTDEEFNRILKTFKSSTEQQ